MLPRLQNEALLTLDKCEIYRGPREQIGKDGELAETFWYGSICDDEAKANAY